MDYDTAKKLKDVGYPQDKRGGENLPNDARTFTVYSPTLSELIQQCGPSRESTHDMMENRPKEYLFRLGFGEEWFACYESDHLRLSTRFNFPIVGWGKTPEIAVANLWLELKDNE